MNYIDKVLTKFRDKVLIEIPDWIYHTGKVEVRYKNPEGEWMVTEFYPGDSEPILERSWKG
jgi:hypothetical protein